MGEKTLKNLEDAFAGESQANRRYLAFAAKAEKEGYEQVARISFWNANEVEKEHAALFKQALGSLGNNEVVEYWVCGNCGHVHLNEAPDKCPVCQVSKSIFKKID
jgi:rubrerythrin